MNSVKLSTMLFLITLMTACGGSGGGSSTPSNPGSSSSSTAATDNSGLVFGDTFNADWGHFSVFEWSNKDNIGKAYSEGQSANFVQWKIVDSGTTDHKSVVEVSYATNVEQSWAQFEVTPTNDLKDLSAYETGKLSFDINVLDWGQTYDQNTGKVAFEARVECGWPCSSHVNLFNVTALNTWVHVEVSAAEMINDGLKINAISRAFIVKPATANEKGLRFQLDNIRWTKGTTKAASKKIIYEEHFNKMNDPDGWNLVSVDGMPNSATYAVQYGLSIYPSYSSQGFYNDWAVENTLLTPIDLSHKKINLQVYVNSTARKFGTLEFISTDSIGRRANVIIQMNQLQADAWNRISFNTDGTNFGADFGFIASDIRKLGVTFRSNFTSASINDPWANIILDEIVITE